MKKESKKSKENKEEKKTNGNKFNIILIILIIILAILIVLELTTGLVFKSLNTFKHFIYRTVGIESKEGNSIGNINNLGYITEDNKYLYYMCPNKNGKVRGISKVSKKDLTGTQTRLIEGDWEIASINSYGDYIYFISLSKNDVDESNENADEVDNKIHRIRKNGAQKDEILNDNEFHNYDYKMAVVGGKIYYIGEDECIWYMDLNGKNKTRLNENASGFEAINDKYIIYNMPKFKDGEDTSVTCIMDRNGKNSREINGERIFDPIIYKNNIYYVTEDNYVHRMDLDGKNDIMLTDDKVYNLNVSDDGIFYFSNLYSSEGKNQGVALFRMDLDGKNSKRIYTLRSSSNTLCLVKDLIFFLDTDITAAYEEVISIDGKQKNILFNLNYSDYYYLDELLEQDEDEEGNEKSDEQQDGEQQDDEQGASEQVDGAQETSEQTE